MQMGVAPSRAGGSVFVRRATRVHAADVDAAQKSRVAVDDQRLAVVALVDLPFLARHQRAERIEFQHHHATGLQLLEQRRRGADGAYAVADQIDLHALLLFGDERAPGQTGARPHHRPGCRFPCGCGRARRLWPAAWLRRWQDRPAATAHGCRWSKDCPPRLLQWPGGARRCSSLSPLKPSGRARPCSALRSEGRARSAVWVVLRRRWRLRLSGLRG